MTHTLLLADDSVTIQRVIELTFAEEDIRVVTVGDGQSAIDRLETSPPDIVLADIDMPKRDGYEVAAYVKSRPKLAHIPVVLLTGAFEPIDQARATAAGSSDVLAKPFEPQMVINRVKQLLGKKRAEPEGSSAGVASPQVPPPAHRPSASIAPAHGLALDTDQPAQQAGSPRASSAPVASPTASLDDYFDQLDAAFSNLQPPGPATHDETMQAREDWILDEESHTPESPGAPAPLITPPGPRAVDPAWVTEPPIVAAPVPPAPLPPAPRPIAPPVALQLEPAPPAHVTTAQVPHPMIQPPVAVVPAPPAAVAPPPPSSPVVNAVVELSTANADVAAKPLAPVITDEVIEEVVARVLQRLSDRVVRETVTDMVSATAERLVQEEILRIKTEAQQ